MTIELEQFKANWEANLSSWKHVRDWELESFKAIIAFANITIRSLLLINGGALVALLAFFGNTWKDSHSVIVLSIPSMKAYLLGLVFAVLVSGVAYIAQHYFTRQQNKAGITFQIIAIIFALISLGSFSCGSWHIANVFSNPN